MKIITKYPTYYSEDDGTFIYTTAYISRYLSKINPLSEPTYNCGIVEELQWIFHKLRENIYREGKCKM
jgi:hypothetical protein